MKLIFFDTPHNLQSISSHDSVGLSLKLFDQPLIIWNINLIDKINKIDTILIPEKYPETYSIVKEQFPTIQVNYASTTPTHLSETMQIATKKLDFSELDQMELNLSSTVYQLKETQEIIIDTIQYPWDYLKAIKNILDNYVLESKISPSAKISKTTVIEGPCIIEENVVIDDFCKIKGPIFIGKGSFVGMGSLVRNCMFGEKTSIGFNCEISKSYFSGHTEIAHHNVILDSVIGGNVWFGGYSGTANVLLTKKNVKYQINDTLIDTGINHFGAVVGDNSAVGAAVIILPGRQIPPNSIIQAGTIFGKK
ncbi:MAG: UDP-3-O-(3-hydroxymyristoyl) glucosamine N-acyltransferase [Nitrosarchaeum sp.]|nr:UDP-3-O-(3-hydroxymyristoyl) glucosamine N-acyltransferase [Nitrosarchaeum sp.]